MDQQTKFKTAFGGAAASAETKDRKLTKADVKEFLDGYGSWRRADETGVCLSGFQAYSMWREQNFPRWRIHLIPRKNRNF